MWHYPEFDPVFLQLGPIAIHWYAITYMAGIGLVWWTVSVRNRRYAMGWSKDALSDLIFVYGILGVILGGRIGYMLFYGTADLIANPLSLLKVWQGGMSFHGGMLGVFIAALVYAKRHQRSVFSVIDFIAPSIPLALGCGRIGNFINGELPGRASELPWAVIYPGDYIARHPSSLYQAITEGLVLFGILSIYAARPRPPMAIAGAFLVGYGLLRLLTEFFREPDAHMGFVAFGWITTGQLLSLPMLILGVGLMLFGYLKKRQTKMMRSTT
jgi:phosphatidylglycerol:prolipoprotein diacylglycerol transferase